MSWATQINKVAGSESDFVEACQLTYKKGGIACIENAINNISQLPELSLIGIQEVNSEIEKKIQEVQPTLLKFERAQINLAIVSILWNPLIFGNLIKKYSFNLVKDDDRPCLILLLKKDSVPFILINLHMPHRRHHKEAIDRINFELDNDKELNKFFNMKNVKIIIMGDFNDPQTTIHFNNPLILKSKSNTIKLKHKKSRKQARQTLKSCCWHKKNHKYKYFSNTGDYILVNKNIKQKYIKIPSIFKKKGIYNRLASDHMPVLSSLIL